MNRLPQVLICDDDKTLHLAAKQALKGSYELRSAYHSEEALVIIRNHPVNLVLLDVQMRTKDEGLQAIPKLLEADPELAIVMISGLTDFATVREAMRLGAMDYVPKDFSPEELQLVIARALERRALVCRKSQQCSEVRREQKRHVLVGQSPAVVTLRRVIERVRASTANVVIFGETGTGKEVVARQLRRTLPDGSIEPFVAVDSATIQSTTAESVLFGHEKGAFTGADRQSKGVFEEADGGTVYFDELANMPLDIQTKLLRAIQEREVTRIGSSRAIPLEFRVICATNQKLEELVRQGKFKDDLYQRLNVLPIEIPPLRQRKEDIPLLVEHFRQAQRGADRLSFTPAAMELLQAYAWPGNIRELGNLVAYLAAMTEGDQVDFCDLPARFHGASAQVRAGFYEAMMRFEKEYLEAELASSPSSVAELATRLGMDRSHLYTKLKKYGISAGAHAGPGSKADRA